MAKQKIEKEAGDIRDILGVMMNGNKESHLNSEVEAAPYKISTGSLKLDHVLDGGLGAGLHRFVGVTEGGKTSEAMLIMANHFKEFPTSRGIYVKAEGRLTDDMIRRSGIKFTKNDKEWEDGTCFILETSIFEFMCRIVSTILLEDKTRKYFIIVDSLDGFIMQGDLAKGFDESMKVAGPAVVGKQLAKRLVPVINKFGHQMIIISQKSADIKLDPYAPNDPRLLSGTGGNALLHFPNVILQFEHRYKGDHILQNDKEQPDIINNQILGHLVTIVVKKSENETSNYKVKYPIRRGRVGSAIWIEKEVFEMLVGWELLEKGGAWFNFAPDLIASMKSKNVELTADKIQGEAKVMKYLEDNPTIVEALRIYLLELIRAPK